MGLFMTGTSSAIPLTAIKYDVQIKGLVCHVTIEQTYRNVQETDVECVYGFPINDQAAITGFTVRTDDRELTSQFMRKEAAFEVYDQALHMGDGAYLMDQSGGCDDTFVMSVGRLPTGKECCVSITYVGTLESVTQTKLRLVIPTVLESRYHPVSKTKVETDTFPHENIASRIPCTATLSGRIEGMSEIHSVASPSHPLSVTLHDLKSVSIAFAGAPQVLDRDLVIDVDVRDNALCHVEVERCRPDKYVAMLEFVPDFVAMQGAAMTEFLFLVDCSGSMYGSKIESARQAMRIFLRSLPEGCRFNFYRFGTKFESLFEISQLYQRETFTQALAFTEATQANMDGTEILAPLQHILHQTPAPGFVRQLFVLTDGEVTNTEAVVTLVSQNADSTRVFSFGTGASPSRSLVNGLAMAGNGKAEFIQPGQLLEDKIGRHLLRALQPAMPRISVIWDGVNSLEQVPKNLPLVFRGDRQIVYAFFNPTMGGTPSVTIKYPIHTDEKDTCLKIALPAENEAAAHNSILSKLAARALIKQLEANIREKNDDIESIITQLSLDYGVMSKYVSLVAVEKTHKTVYPVINNLPPRNRYGAQTSGFLTTYPVHNATADLSSLSLKSDELIASSKHFIKTSRDISTWSSTVLSTLSNALQGISTAFFGNPNSRTDTSRQNPSTGPRKDPENAGNMETASADLLPSPLNALLNLQKWDGSWEATVQLESLTNRSVIDLLKMLPGDVAPTMAATALAVVFIEEHFKEGRNVWQAIIQKGRLFLEKNSNDRTALALLEGTACNLVAVQQNSVNV